MGKKDCTRRQFLGAGALGGFLVASGGLRIVRAAGGGLAAAPTPKVRICALFAGLPGPAGRGWSPRRQVVDSMKKRLAEIEKKLGNVEFVTGHARNAQEASALLEKAGKDAPVLAINLGIGALLRVAPPILQQQRPMAVFSLPASGHDWMYPPRWQGEGKPVTLFATSDYDELERATRLLRVIPMLRQTRVLVFEPMQGTPPSRDVNRVKKRLGADVVTVTRERFDGMIDALDEDAVGAEAEWWLDNAKKVVEPTRQQVVKAARVGLALNHLVDEEKVHGVAVGPCMSWRALPCLGFTRLRDRGIPASCEGDMDSLWTMLMFGYAFDIPGFQGNQTFDTSRDVLWTAHCVGPTKMDGPDGERAPYLLRSHSESGESVVPEIQYRIGQKITRAKFINLDTMLISTAKIIEVPEKSFRACRTQIVTRVDNSAKMVRNWGGGVLEGGMMTLLHRVVFYGDHMDSMLHLAELMGFELVNEGVPA